MKFRKLEHGRTLWVGTYLGYANTREEYRYRLYVGNGKAIKLGSEIPDPVAIPFLKALGVKTRLSRYGRPTIGIGVSCAIHRLKHTLDHPLWKIDEEIETFYNTLGNRKVLGLLFPDEEKLADFWLARLRDGITGEPEGDAEELVTDEAI